MPLSVKAFTMGWNRGDLLLTEKIMAAKSNNKQNSVFLITILLKKWEGIEHAKGGLKSSIPFIPIFKDY
jgi:hypothetical protein